jgi:ribosomal protein S14
VRRCNVCQRFQLKAGLCRVCLPELAWWSFVAFVLGFAAAVMIATR